MVMTSGPSLDQLKNRMRATWMAGDFGKVARLMRHPGESVAERVNLPPGARVLDMACGTGNVAVPLARRGLAVTGVDIAPNLLEQARAWAAEERLTIRFDEGDAEALPYEDGWFDAVVTMFGAMFAPRPEVVAAEMARVLQPGGLLVMGNWTPESFTGQMFAVGAEHVAPPAGVARPVLWGDEATVHERLTAHFRKIEAERMPVDFDLPMSPAQTVAFFREFFGPTKMTFARLEEAEQAVLAEKLKALWTGANVAEDPAQHTLVRSEYLLVRARRR